jgi:hypothetical protein
MQNTSWLTRARWARQAGPCCGPAAVCMCGSHRVGAKKVQPPRNREGQRRCVRGRRSRHSSSESNIWVGGAVVAPPDKLAKNNGALHRHTSSRQPAARGGGAWARPDTRTWHCPLENIHLPRTQLALPPHACMLPAADRVPGCQPCTPGLGRPPALPYPALIYLPTLTPVDTTQLPQRRARLLGPASPPAPALASRAAERRCAPRRAGAGDAGRCASWPVPRSRMMHSLGW